jgi:hypothetical protein
VRRRHIPDELILSEAEVLSRKPAPSEAKGDLHLSFCCRCFSVCHPRRGSAPKIVVPVSNKPHLLTGDPIKRPTKIQYTYIPGAGF